MTTANTSSKRSLLARSQVCAAFAALMMVASSSTLAEADISPSRRSASDFQVAVQVSGSCAVSIDGEVANLEASPEVTARCNNAANPFVASSTSSFVNAAGETIPVLVTTVSF